MKTTMIQSAPVTFEVYEVFSNKVRDHFTDVCKMIGVTGDPFKDHFVEVNKMVDLGLVCMRSTNKAPKGRKVIAQGNALGMRIYRYPSPVRAQLAHAGHYSDQIDRRTFSQSALNVPPLQGLRGGVHPSQGVALGYLMLPLCGKVLSSNSKKVLKKRGLLNG